MRKIFINIAVLSLFLSGCAEMAPSPASQPQEERGTRCPTATPTVSGGKEQIGTKVAITGQGGQIGTPGTENTLTPEELATHEAVFGGANRTGPSLTATAAVSGGNVGIGTEVAITGPAGQTGTPGTESTLTPEELATHEAVFGEANRTGPSPSGPEQPIPTSSQLPGPEQLEPSDTPCP